MEFRNKELSSDSEESGKRSFLYRYVIIAVLFVLVCILYVINIGSIQLNNTGALPVSSDKYFTRKVTVQAVRGEIFDRNGVPLVTNEYSYSLIFDYDAMANRYVAQNEDILTVLRVLSEEDAGNLIPETSCALRGFYPYMFYDTIMTEEGSIGKARLKRVCAALGVPEDTSAPDLAAAFATKYSMLDAEGNPRYSNAEMTELIRVRYEMLVIRFSSVQPYIFAEGIDLRIMTRIAELNIRGTDIRVSYERVYQFPGIASHILGRIGKIYAQNVEYYTSLGYPVTAVVGNSGCELAFEKILRGMDGEMLITEDENGNVVSTEMIKEPEAGQDIYLTIDINLQITAEAALEENVAYVVDKALSSAGNLDGEDCDCGALVAQSVKNGEILAIASYPTYDLVTFGRDYNDLIADKRNPLFNRALDGTYAPGSTFKVGVAAAALTEGIRMDDGSIFTAKTIIDTKGKYTFYTDDANTPRCWLYSKAYGYRSHGKINVISAIQVSCNCFFYEVGRVMGIDTLNRYATLYGLGQKTGIELGESLGVLADEGYASARGESMSGENTLRTAIGQGFSAFTPLQINNYIATIANGGTRYAAHLLREVRDFGAESDENNITKPQVLATVPLNRADLDTLKLAMSKVIEGSTTITSFSDFPLTVGGKTGTAEKDGQSNNAIFVAIAPLDDPELAVTCVIERGAKGANASRSVRKVLDKYFGYAD